MPKQACGEGKKLCLYRRLYANGFLFAAARSGLASLRRDLGHIAKHRYPAVKLILGLFKLHALIGKIEHSKQCAAIEAHIRIFAPDIINARIHKSFKLPDIFIASVPDDGEFLSCETYFGFDFIHSTPPIDFYNIIIPQI